MEVDKENVRPGNVPPAEQKDPRGVLRTAADRQVAALLPRAPADFATTWERLEAEKLGGVEKGAKEAQYRARVLEVKRALKANAALVEAVAAGTVTPQWLVAADSAALASKPHKTPRKKTPAKSPVRKEGASAARHRAKEARAARRYELQYLRQLTARSPGEYEGSDSDDESQPDFAAMLNADVSEVAAVIRARPEPVVEAAPSPELPQRRKKKFELVQRGPDAGSSTPEVNAREDSSYHLPLPSPPKFGTPPGLSAAVQRSRQRTPRASPRGSPRARGKEVRYKPGRDQKPKHVAKDITKKPSGRSHGQHGQPHQGQRRRDAYDEKGRRARREAPPAAAAAPEPDADEEIWKELEVDQLRQREEALRKKEEELRRLEEASLRKREEELAAREAELRIKLREEELKKREAELKAPARKSPRASPPARPARARTPASKGKGKVTPASKGKIKASPGSKAKAKASPKVQKAVKRVAKRSRPEDLPPELRTAMRLRAANRKEEASPPQYYQGIPKKGGLMSTLLGTGSAVTLGPRRAQSARSLDI